MKTLVLTILLAFSSLAIAVENPAEFCKESSCTEKMESILGQYLNSGLSFILKPVSAYSGSCWHNNGNYDPSTEHHSAFIFELDDHGLFTTGVFSFFAGTNPYATMSGPELYRWFKKNDPTMARVNVTDKDAELAYLYPESAIRYWFRNTGEKLFLIGKEAGSNYINTVFCELERHQD